jgi:putative acetyltransferase
MNVAVRDDVTGRLCESPAGLSLRPRRPSDAEELAELANLPGYRFGKVRGWIEKAPSTTVSLVAVVDGRIVGQAGLYRLGGRRAHVADVGLGVHDAWAGRGVGTALMAALVDAADRWSGVRRLQLTVYVDNAAAIRLFKRFDFEIDGTHHAYSLRDGQYVDVHAMARLRAPGLHPQRAH